MKTVRFHDVMRTSAITARMTPHIIKAETWRPSNPTILCADLPCEPPYPADRKPTAPHAHIAVPMLVPIAVSAAVTMGRTRVVN